jgi:molybdopterin-guanine dinucleotide biosynthesis protein A
VFESLFLPFPSPPLWEFVAWANFVAEYPLEMGEGYAEAESFVLAGGRSSRMGQDKALLQLGGKSMLRIALDKLRALPLPAPPRVAGARLDAAAVADLHPGCGPLGGIEAALTASSRPLNVFVPLDMPLLPAKFLVWMLYRAQITGAMATVPRINGRPQPLCAVYHRDLLGPITTSLLAGDYKVMRVVSSAAPQTDSIDIFDVELVSSADAEMLAFSPLPAFRWFHNCNTPEDIAGIENALFLTQ